MATTSLPPGEVRPAVIDGHDIVLWRAHDGTIGAVDRTCPHLDWDLAEARVVGNELVCPGHGWSLTCEGRVFKRNEYGREDDKGSTTSWSVAEQHGQIVAFN